MKNNALEFIPGTTNIILVAPHGHPKNDINTGELVRRMAKILNCHAVINEHYRKPYTDETTGIKYVTDKKTGIVDLNDIDEIKKAKMEEEYVLPIIAIKDKILALGAQEALVIHVHGKGDDKDKNDKVDNKEPFLLVGCGMPDRLSADIKIVDDFVKSVAGSKEHSLAPRIENDGEYSGWDRRNLNQLFTGFVNPKFKDERVQSIQLEIKYTGFRDDENNLDRTAETLSSALRDIAGLNEEDEQEGQLSPPPEIAAKPAAQPPAIIKQSTEAQVSQLSVEKKPDDALVEQAYSDLKEIFITHYEAARSSAMLEAGRYIIKTFYGDDYKLAKSKKKAVKRKSLNQLIKKLQEQSNDAPPKTWIYEAVALAVDECELESFRTYGNLSVSHKLKLLKVKDIDKKKQLAEEIVAKTLSVRSLSARVKEISGSEPGLLDVLKNPAKLFAEGFENRYSDESLATLQPEQHATIEKSISEETQKLQHYLDRYKELSERLNRLKKK